MGLASIDPATGRQVATWPAASKAELDAALRRSAEAFEGWSRAGFEERAAVLRRAAALLRAEADANARLMAQEMGKPLPQGRAEVEKCAWACEHYAEHAERYLAPEPVATDARRSFVAYLPLGVVLAVMPWNFPFWQVFRFAAPALMAGNAGVLKHAGNVPGCALAIEELLRRAGFPGDLFRTVLVPGRKVAALIRHPRVAAVTLTGSTEAGRSVARAAGGALKKTVLELGGSDPYLVLDDADLESAVRVCVASRLTNGGQSCIAAKRFVVVEGLRKAFEEGCVARMRAVVMGDPLREETQLGPQARRELRDELHAQVRRSVDAGARLLLGGEIPPGPGAFYPPTVLSGVRRGMPACDEELFGPVAAILPVRDEVEAIAVANDSVFGLGAAVFTRDAARGERIAERELEAGACFVNASVRSDPRLPFGGIKTSGFGRELSYHGIREFVNVKTVYVG
jgi:succinate-semialdehyde dehydrogenase/glutarate-semialdehyde dehydrogenase